MLVLLIVIIATGCAGRRGKKLHEWNESVLLNPGESAAVQVYAEYGHATIYNRGPGMLALRSPSTGEKINERYVIEPDGFQQLRVATVRSMGFANNSANQRILFYIDIDARDMIVMTSGAMGTNTYGDIPERSRYDEPVESQMDEEGERTIFDEIGEFLDSLNPF